MDQSELKAHLERYHNDSYGWALSCCWRDPADAEDVLQIAYLKVLEGRARFRGEASFKTWLFAVIRKTALSERRRNLLRLLKLNRAGREWPHCPAGTVHPDDAVHRSETQSRFRRALSELPRRQQEVLQLVFYHDLSLADAARIMSVSLGSARTHYDRGKKRLRELLEEEYKYDSEWRRNETAGTVP